MLKPIVNLSPLALVFLTVAMPTSARAQTSPPPPITAFGSGGSGFGVGAAAFLSGVAGVEAVYDQPRWHAEGLFGFSSTKPGAGPNPPTTTIFNFGLRGWYHVHTGVSSDFSLGGGLGFVSFSTSNNGASGTTTSIEPGIQARVFLTPNFNLHATAGLSLTFGGNANPDGRVGVSMTEQFLGGLGFTYFFR
jgi:hypothetical protein